MTRMVHCVKLGKEAEGMKFPPLPNELGKRIFENVSQEAWMAWTRHQTMLINENRLSLPIRARANTSPSRWNNTSSATAQMPYKAMFRKSLNKH